MSSVKSVPSSDPRDEQSRVFPPWTPLGDRRGKNSNLSPTVTIFGAGIAGLSAAHELIERGFSVQVVEPTRSPEDEYGAEVGGMARNQFGRVAVDPVTLHGGEPRGDQSLEDFRSSLERIVLLRSARMRPVQRRFPVPWRIRFERDGSGLDPTLTDEWGVKNARKLASVFETLTAAYRAYKEDLARAPERSLWWYEKDLPIDWRCREVLYVEVRGHTDGDGEAHANRELSKQWADQVLAHLARLNLERSNTDAGPEAGGIPPSDFPFHFCCEGVGSTEPLGDQRKGECRRRSNRVEFRIVELLVPGEHGYRFFPAFYRHLFDTMRRTPILDEQNHETGQTAYDRLVATRDFGLALEDGRALPSIETRRVRGLEELRRHAELFFRRLGVSHRDLARFQVRLLKFLTSSPERRRREYEGQSWWTFLGGDSERGYSPRMKQYLVETPQALVAMNAEETDARSQGNIVTQLLLHYFVDRFDLTLNGPTTQVWLREWKRYLTRQGVRFFVGELGKLEWDDGQLVPLTIERSAWLEPRTPPGQTAKAWMAGAVVPTVPLPTIRPQPPTVEIEVLDCDDGEYSIFVADRTYCFTASGRSCEDIAAGLAQLVNEDAAVSAEASGSRIVITEEQEIRRPIPDGELLFDESIRAGAWESGRARTISGTLLREDIPSSVEDVLKAKIARSHEVLKNLNRLRQKLVRPSSTNQAVQKLLELVDGVNVTGNFQPLSGNDFEQWLNDATLVVEKDALLSIMNRARSQQPGVLAGLDDAEWVRAGRLRATDARFDKLLSDFEQIRRPRREVVPRIEIDTRANVVTFKRPAWVEDVDKAEGAQATNFVPLFPYYFRVRPVSQVDDPGLLIRVRNADGNLGILAEPIGEDSAHDYMSHTERRPAFRPDFYILALPFQDASKLVWRAEQRRAGYLDGCLAELLDFDRRTYRRSQRGTPLRLVRDPHGRPPLNYPLRDFSGVQYYFHNHVRIGKGHIYFPDAQWGLSSISQLAYWRERMSPSGPFMGQLSVDIGNFYAPAPARRGSRVPRSGWHSTSREIVMEVWQQVRAGLERQRAGVLAAPDFVHLDEWLRFDDVRGSAFRDDAVILVRPDARQGDYTIWINGERFTTTGTGTSRQIAERLRDAVGKTLTGLLEATVEEKTVASDGRPEAIVHKEKDEALEIIGKASLAELERLESAEREHRKVAGGRDEVIRAIQKRRRELRNRAASRFVDPNAEYLLRISSKVAAEEALIVVSGDDAGSYELTIGRPFRYAALPGSNDRLAIRNGLFEQLVHDPHLPVTPLTHGATSLLLRPKGGEPLPPIAVRNEHQNLRLLFGSTLHVRLEQRHGRLSFENLENATIGYNDAPFLINVPGHWSFRPGVLAPGEPDPLETRPDQAMPSPVLYRISNGRWLATGTYMATTTRLTTMEAANESARHAVNAILHRLVSGRGTDYNAEGRMFADWAEIWDPEKNELDDVEPLKRLDQKLVEDGLPHVFDILRLLDGVDALPMHGQPSHDPMANVLHLFQHAAEGLGRDWGFLDETLYGLMAQAAERVHDGLDPLGLLRGIKGAPNDLAERIRRAVRSFVNGSDGRSSDEDSGTPGS